MAYPAATVRKLLLGAAGLLALALTVLFDLLHETPSQAQAQSQSQSQNTGARSLVYDVVSIKPNKSGNETATLLASRNGFIARSITLRSLIGDAYRVADHQISGAPDWLNSEKYDIEAKMDSSTADELRKFTKDQTKIERLRMLQSILSDRLKLTVHRETKELPIYALVVAKDGPKLHEAKPGDTYPNGIKGPDGIGRPGYMNQTIGAGGRSEFIGQGITMASLVGLLSEQLHRTVLDKTGLAGNYDFKLEWTVDENQTLKGIDGDPMPDSPTADSSGPSIFTAIQDQLGLKLESKKGPVEILVIDHVEKPSEN